MGTVSTGQEVEPAGVSELPAIVVPAARSSAAARRSQRGMLRSTLAVLGAAGLTVAVIAPTGVVLAGPPATAVEPAPDAFSLVLADAQTLTLDADTGATFTTAERGTFTVFVKPKPTPTPRPATASGSGGGAPRYTGGGAPAEWMAQAGIAESDRGFVDYIVRRESGWNPNATNRRSGACGLVQVYPCGKLANAYDPVVNLRWADGYAKGRYGSWEKAYQFWTRNHWW